MRTLASSWAGRGNTGVTSWPPAALGAPRTGDRPPAGAVCPSGPRRPSSPAQAPPPRPRTAAPARRSAVGHIDILRGSNFAGSTTASRAAHLRDRRVRRPEVDPDEAERPNGLRSRVSSLYEVHGSYDSFPLRQACGTPIVESTAYTSSPAQIVFPSLRPLPVAPANAGIHEDCVNVGRPLKVLHGNGVFQRHKIECLLEFRAVNLTLGCARHYTT